MRRLSRFQIVILTLALLVHTPWVLTLATLLGPRLGAWPTVALCALCAALMLQLFWGRARRVMHDEPRPSWQVTFVDLPVFVHLSALTFGFFPALLVLALWGFGSTDAEPLRWVYVGAYLLGLYGVYLRRRWFRVRSFDVNIPSLPSPLEGLRVAHLSDLHVGALLSPAQMRRWVRATHAAKPDLIVLTGDYVTSGTAFHQAIAELIGSLQAPLGVFASMGNHDYFGDGEPLISLLRARGVHVLRNEGQVIERDGGALYLAAADDVWTRRADMEQTLSGWDASMPCLLLAHDPALFDQAAERKVALTLSGHTHGGQLAIPFLARWLSLSHLAHRYHLGFYRRGASTLYVSPGLGTTGLPLRFGTTPTVAIHVLRAGGAGV